MIQNDKERDSNWQIRDLELRRILKVRQIDARRKTVRVFTPLKVNNNAEECSEMINWMHCEFIFSPVVGRNQ